MNFDVAKLFGNDSVVADQFVGLDARGWAVFEQAIATTEEDKTYALPMGAVESKIEYQTAFMNDPKTTDHGRRHAEEMIAQCNLALAAMKPAQG